MFGSKEDKFSLQGKLLNRLLKDNHDWIVVTDKNNISILFSPTCFVSLHPRSPNGYRHLGISHSKEEPFVYDAFNNFENRFFFDAISKMIREIKDNKVISGLQKAVNLISKTDCQQERS